MHLPPFFTIGDFAFGKQNVLILLSVVIIAVFFLTAARKRAMVPGKTQFIAESGYMFARNSSVRKPWAYSTTSRSCRFCSPPSSSFW